MTPANATASTLTDAADLAGTVVTITDPVPGMRRSEPIIFEVPVRVDAPLWWAETATGERVLCQRLATRSSTDSTALVVTLSFEGSASLRLTGPCEEASPTGIAELPGKEADCFVRLDTGAFDLEMCSGTAQGTGASKWGLRHFRGTEDGLELLPSGNNAIGGFYGPFFTPENGLINPPEHTVVEIETIEKGPVMHHYRMKGTIPDGLLDELKGKSFTIDWIFTHGTPFFQRRYLVDPFRTVINGRSVDNKITVGDEFEGGQGELVFDRFAAYQGTVYRSGDPYAGELVEMVRDTLETSTEDNPKFAEFRRELKDIEAAHWDLYWRMFCTWEGVLSDDEIRERLGRVRAESHMKADLTSRVWEISSEPVNVSAMPHETIFQGAANKTAELHEASGRAMVWWTSEPSGAFQIVQRKQSGWVNWGSNGENECPELPVGVDIKTAYGTFAENWKVVADQLEQPPHVAVNGSAN
ncbi:hypothetical protein [Sinorhizobium alkalisoli]|uniref:hypothetical protein n=1 Tax=Sinorhizobium alkalisoli TaxID=1752398 RepID=UPI0012A812D7|nr:hypothetical protein [Sinorhizobium alkalisoli]MCG5480947.1 hypothetical protein [Sinorhizobium alkalisoli]QFI70072.1 hypothetical protein EKH55_5198 [Sinorhizobium alkalisoli]